MALRYSALTVMVPNSLVPQCFTRHDPVNLASMPPVSTWLGERHSGYDSYPYRWMDTNMAPLQLGSGALLGGLGGVVF